MDYKPLSDTELVHLIRDGDKKAFDTFFIRYYAVLCAYSNQFVCPDDGEDIVQDIMANTWMNRKNMLIPSFVRRYFFQAVKNRCLSFLSRNELKMKIQKTLHEHFGYPHDHPDFYVVAELTAKIEESLKRLPESYRTAFELNRVKEMTYNEIAKELALSPKTIDYRIQQALKLLRRDLREYLPMLTGVLG